MSATDTESNSGTTKEYFLRSKISGISQPIQLELSFSNTSSTSMASEGELDISTILKFLAEQNAKRAEEDAIRINSTENMKKQCTNCRKTC